jgi:RimJ/RimL family protein N-acetyltransferase
VTNRPQPTLRDGDVVLRPWQAADIDVALSGHDEIMARWLDASEVNLSHDQHAEAVASWREQYADARRVVSFVVERSGDVAGRVEVRRVGDDVGELSWRQRDGAPGGATVDRVLLRRARIGSGGGPYRPG